MPFSLILEHSWWWLLPCLLAAGAMAFLLYQKHRFGEEYNRSKIIWGLGVLRASWIFLLLFLLLGPMLKTIFQKEENPVLVIAADNSSSLVKDKGSASARAAINQLVKDLGESAGKSFDVALWQFGEQTLPLQSALDLKDRQTDLSDLLKTLDKAYQNQNVGAIILLTDGIYNKGRNPLGQPLNLQAPIYPVALGDTVRSTDARIRNVRHNRIAYLGNKFMTAVQLHFRLLQGKQAQVKVLQGDKELQKQSLSITSDDFHTELNFSLEAAKKGMQRYTVVIEPLAGELTLANNRFDIFVEVLDGRQKILIVGSAPHPDLGALKQAIESNENYEAGIKMTAQVMNSELKAYSLVVIHQGPTSFVNTSGLIQAVSDQNLPALYILGEQTDLNRFSLAAAGETVGGTPGMSANDAQASYNKDFNAFLLEEGARNSIDKFPPLASPHGNYALQGTPQVLAYQKLGYVTSSQPLIAFTEINGRKAGFINGTGFWKWRLSDYEENENHNATNELVNKIVQFLSVKSDSRKFRVQMPGNIFDETDPVIFEAELYNDAFEPVTGPDVRMQLQHLDSKQQFDLVFSKNNRSYYLQASNLPPGNYSYKASTSLGNRQETATGIFTIRPIQVEQMEHTADHSLLRSLAAGSKGAVFYPDEAEGLLKAIRDNEAVKPVTYAETRLDDLIQKPWWFIVVVILASAEWFIRKYLGDY